MKNESNQLFSYKPLNSQKPSVDPGELHFHLVSMYLLNNYD